MGVDLNPIQGTSGASTFTETYQVSFYEVDGDYHTIGSDEAFILTLLYENQDTGEIVKGVYLINPVKV